MESILDLPLSCCGLMKGYGLLQCSPMRNGTQQIKFVFIVFISKVRCRLYFKKHKHNNKKKYPYRNKKVL